MSATTSPFPCASESAAGCPVSAFGNSARWVAWRLDRIETPRSRRKSLDDFAEAPASVRTAKVPYCSAAQRAETNNAATWLTLRDAQALAGLLPGAQGVGVVLGVCGTDPAAIGGMDLDTCIDPHSGEVAGWARHFVDLLDSYAEVSPSGTGIKVYFTYDPSALPGLAAAMGTKGGKLWKRRTVGDHPPAVELYLAGRWFAVTGNRMAEAPACLNHVGAEQLYRIIAQDGPAFASRASGGAAADGNVVPLSRTQQPVGAASGLPPLPATADLADRVDALCARNAAFGRVLEGRLDGLADQSRSGVAMSLGGHLRRDGRFSFDDMVAILSACEHTASWAAEKGVAHRGREFRRIWNRAASAPPSCAPASSQCDFAGPAAERPPERPTIRLAAGDCAAQIADAEAALIASDLDVFQRGGGVVFSGYARDHDGQAERPVRKLVDVNEVGMADLFNRAATWTRYDARAKMDVAARCPESLARIYLARGGIGWKLPVLRGLITSPTLLRDGSVLETPGYHAGSGLFFEPDGTDFPLIPRWPTRDDALTALALIDDLLEECAFVDATDRSVALAMILTGLVRRDLEAAPLFALTAPTPGTGKSFLASVAAFMATGRKPAGVGWVAGNDNENAKVLDAALLAGGPVLLLDNIVGELNSARLNAMLSQSEVNVRVLGGHREVTVPCNTLVLANGNNLVLPADMVRRSMLC